MALTFDVAVVGGGIAGVAAALAARARGAQVCIIRAAPGATALSSGAWSGPLRSELQAALAAAHHPLAAVDRALPHERGHSVQADFAAASHARITTETTTVVGFAGLPSFNARVLARLWQPRAPLLAHTVELPDTPSGGWSAPSLAASIERNTEPLIQQLRSAGVSAAIFPAVLGIDSVATVISRLETAGIQAAEALAGTPSIPGWRLQQAMDRALSRAGVTALNGRAAFEATSAAHVEHLTVGEEIVRARSFVLATGKYLGGGIAAETEFRETVFGLPVWLEQLGDVFTAPDSLTLTDPVRTSDQPLLSAGVHADEDHRPVDRAHDVVYENVFVAGTIRADWATAGRGLGDCAEDGWSAGARAAA